MLEKHIKDAKPVVLSHLSIIEQTTVFKAAIMAFLRAQIVA